MKRRQRPLSSNVLASRTLVLGSTGFLGSHLVRMLRSEGLAVAGLARRNRAGGVGATILCDLTTERASLSQVLSEVQPGIVFHLAAPDASPEDDVAVVGQTLSMTDNVLHAALRLQPRPTVVLVSSSAVYGDSGGKMLRESSPLAPVTLNGVSKVLAETLALRAFKTVALPVIVARLFNLIGPGQGPDRAVSRFAREIGEREATGSRSPLRTHGLGAYRDLIDVRDAARALLLLSWHGTAGTAYNICSGRAVRMEFVLRRMLRLRGMTGVPVQAGEGHGVLYQRGDCRRLRALGWHPRFSLDDSLRDTLDDWRQRIRRGES